jgi:uncharacterized protein (TIGR03437 family)
MQSFTATSARARLVGLLTLLLLLLAAGYAMRRTLLVSAHAQSAAVPPVGSPLGDFNGDGILDVAYANHDDGDGDGSVVVEFGLGDGSFLGRVKYRLGRSVRETVAVGDFNNDGQLDLAVTHMGIRTPTSPTLANTVSVLLGDGAGSFDTRKDYRFAEDVTMPFVAGDFDRDGKLDLLFFHISQLRLLAGNGDGSFTPRPHTLFRLRRSPVTPVAGDFNLDGKLDVALANDPYGVSVLTGRGDGTFEGQADYLTGGNVWGVTAGDLNLDGKPDLVAVNEYGSSISILYNQGDGTFGGRRDYGYGSNTRAVRIADVNGDGRPDVLMTVRGSDNKPYLAVFPGRCDGTVGAQENLPLPGAAVALSVADLDGNGKADIVAVQGGFTGSASVILNPAIGQQVGTCPPPGPGPSVSFTQPFTFAVASKPYSLAVGDYNNDGKPDLVALGWEDPRGLTTYLNKGDGTFPAWSAALPQTPLPFGHAIRAAELNHDGKLDLAALSVSQGDVKLVSLLGQGDGSFTAGAEILLGTFTEVNVPAFVVADFNGDGKADIACASSRLRVLLGRGDGTFAPPIVLETGYGTLGLAGDFTGDGKLDLVLAYGSNYTFTLLVGEGDGTFAPLATDAAGKPIGTNVSGLGFATWVNKGDFNNDGKLDLLITDRNRLAVLLGKGDGTFESKITVPEVSVTLGHATTGDFNQDGKLDVALGSQSSLLIVLPGNGDGTFAQNLVVATGYAPTLIDAADFNGDGKPDIAVPFHGQCAATCQSALSVFYNSGGAVTPTPTPTPTPTVFAITGYTLDSAGRAVSGVNVALTGAQSATTTTNAQGFFSFVNLPAGGSYTLKPSGANFNYTPVTQAVTNLRSNQTITFTTRAPDSCVTVHAATYDQNRLAPESIASLFGANLATTGLPATTLPLPTSWGGTTVRVRDSRGDERLAPLFYVSWAQINFQVPVNTALGVATVIVTSADGTVSADSVNIEPTAPGLFSANNSGEGYAAAHVQRVKASGEQAFEPTLRFDPQRNEVVPVAIDLGPEGEQVYLVLYGTGLRFRHFAATAKINGVEATVAYCGPQQTLVGLDQVNILIPRALKGAGEVNVALLVDERAVNVVKVKIK